MSEASTTLPHVSTNYFTFGAVRFIESQEIPRLHNFGRMSSLVVLLVRVCRPIPLSVPHAAVVVTSVRPSEGRERQVWARFGTDPPCV